MVDLPHNCVNRLIDDASFFPVLHVPLSSTCSISFSLSSVSLTFFSPLPPHAFPPPACSTSLKDSPCRDLFRGHLLNLRGGSFSSSLLPTLTSSPMPRLPSLRAVLPSLHALCAPPTCFGKTIWVSGENAGIFAAWFLPAVREPRRGLRIKRRGREGGSEGGGGGGRGGNDESEAFKVEERAWDALKGGISVQREGGKQEVERRERKEGGDFFANRRARQAWEENERRAALEYEGWTEEGEEEEGEGEEEEEEEEEEVGG
ncbi:hypothetical protein Naga_100640g4, partial [Nannochloropsis gaditana]